MRSVALLFLGIQLVFAKSNVICERVIGHVGETITPTCRVLPPSQDLCILRYKFMDNHYKTICEEEISDPCQQWTSFSCPYTAKTIMINPWDQFYFKFEQKDVVTLIGIYMTITDFAKITCEHVTCNVREKFTCSVSYQSDRCCILAYKFMKNAKDDDSTICKEDFSYNPCQQPTIFSCPDTENTMTANVYFSLNTTCGPKTTEFTVDVKDRDDCSMAHKEGNHSISEAVIVPCIIVGSSLSLLVLFVINLILWRNSRQVKSQKLTGDVKETAQNTSIMSLVDRPNF